MIRLKKRALQTGLILSCLAFGLFANEGEVSVQEQEEQVLDIEKAIDESSLISKNYHLKETKKARREGITNSWRPQIELNRQFESVAPYSANFNVGLGLLYFSGSAGNYMSVSPGDATNKNNANGALFSRWKYNKTPLTEATMIWNLGGTIGKVNWLGLGVSFLHQGGVEIKYINKVSTVLDGDFLISFSGIIELNALVGKLFFYYPASVIMKGVAYSPYLGLSFGPSWQTWRNLNTTVLQGTRLDFQQKVSANCFFGTELGIKIRSFIPNSALTGILGLKFNLWGAAREMGRECNQFGRSGGSGNSYGLLVPFKVKMVYQWSPFLGMNFAF